MLLISIFGNSAVMWILLAGFLTLCIADLFKRHLLSNKAVYCATMLLAPAAALAAVTAPIYSLTDGSSAVKIVLSFIGGILLILTVGAVYVRGHISPVDKNEYGSNAGLAAVVRLIIVGEIGTALYGVLFIIGCADLFNMLGSAEIAFGLPELICMLYLLLIPIFNLIFILGLIIGYGDVLLLGAAIAAFVCLLAVMPIFANALTINGCIRYILTTDKTKGKKVLFIILSLIPVFNIVYGIICLADISKRLKSNY